MSKKVIELAYHRNGVCGAGFHVGIVEEVEDGETRHMVVVRFSREADDGAGAKCCAAFDIAKLTERVIAFGQNSWRGDRYASVIDEAIDKANCIDPIDREIMDSQP